MNWKSTILVAIALLLPRPGEAADNPTRLYVRTEPSGATVTVGDKTLGRSDELFVVQPGKIMVKVELAGYQAQVRELDLLAGRITRIEVQLLKAASPKPETNSDETAASTAAIIYLERTDLAKPLGAALQATVRQHPTDSRWSGQQGSIVFAVVSKRIPDGPFRNEAVPPLLNLTHSLAVSELLTAKGLLDLYTQHGLTNATALRQAVVRVTSDLRIGGEVKSFKHLASSQGDFVVAYVLAEADQLTAQVTKPAELDKVKQAYREVVHAQARDLMSRDNWPDALQAWKHLHERKLVSPELYLDAARCLMKLNQHDDATRLLQEAFDAFQASATPSFLERAGDLALEIGSPKALAIAEQAYRDASKKLLNTITQPNDSVGKPADR